MLHTRDIVWTQELVTYADRAASLLVMLAVTGGLVLLIRYLLSSGRQWRS